jgi:hypothetical protein
MPWKTTQTLTMLQTLMTVSPTALPHRTARRVHKP